MALSNLVTSKLHDELSQEWHLKNDDGEDVSHDAAKSEHPVQVCVEGDRNHHDQERDPDELIVKLAIRNDQRN